MNFSKRRLLLAALLAAAVLALYGRVAGYDFISIDDNEYVYENAQVCHGLSWASVVWAFKTPVAGNWHPLTMLSHMLDCQLWGPRPGGQHLTNALLHLANTLLLFWVLLKMTDRSAAPVPARAAGRTAAAGSSAPSTVWLCAFVAALFALHPLHVESVAWVSERKDVLSAFFFMLTLLAYTQYAKSVEGRVSRGGLSQVQSLKSKVKETSNAPDSTQYATRNPQHAHPALWYLLALLCFTLGLLSKPMLVTLPFVLLLLDYWPLGRLNWDSRPAPSNLKSQISNSKSTTPTAATPSSNLASFKSLLLEKVPFLVLTAVFSLLTFVVQSGSGAVVSLEEFPLKPRLANAAVAYARYLGKTFWPDALAIPYPHLQWPADVVTGATLLLVIVSLLAFATARRQKYFFVGWFWFVGMLVPVIGLVQAGMQGMADRFTYLPLIGLFIVLAWGLASLPVVPAQRRWVGMAALAVLAALAAATSVQLSHWKNSVTLFEHAVKVIPNNSAGRFLLGAQYEARGQLEQAFLQFSEAVRDNPANVRARCGLGYLLRQQGKLDEAVQQYEAALQAQPDLAKAHFGLAEVLRHQGRVDPAIAHYLATLQLKPDLAEAHYQVAGLFNARHDSTNTLSHLQEAVRLAPDWPLPLNDLAWALATRPQAELRNGPAALRLAVRAVSLTQRQNPGTLDTLAAAYAEASQFVEAVATAQTALQQATAAGQTNLAAEIESHLKLYQAQKPCRE